jgi:hemoglobin-like flavoprotein
MLSDQEKSRIRASWRLLAPMLDTAVDLFCRRLFEQRPDYRVLFPEDLSGAKKSLARLLETIVRALDWPESAWRDEVPEEDDLFLTMLALGRRHGELQGVADDRYQALGEALIWTLDYALGEPFDAACREAWTHLNTLLAGALRLGRLSAGERPAERAPSARPPRSSRPQPAKRGGALS